METKQPSQRLLPYAISKKNLFALYSASGMSVRDIRTRINSIVADNRKLPDDVAANKKLIWHDEFKEFVELYGVPAGYKNEFQPQ